MCRGLNNTNQPGFSLSAAASLPACMGAAWEPSALGLSLPCLCDGDLHVVWRVSASGSCGALLVGQVLC